MSRFWLNIHLRTRGQVWIVPTLYVVGALVLGVLTARARLPVTIAGQLGFFYTPATAISILAAIATGMITFTGIVFSMLLVIVQFGSTAYTPRLLGYVLVTSMVQHGMGVFIATFVYSLAALALVDVRRSGYVPDVPILLSLVLVLTSALMFIALMQSLTGLQVGKVLNMLGRRGREVIDDLYPMSYSPSVDLQTMSSSLPLPPISQSIEHGGGPVIVAALDIPLLVGLAQYAQAVVIINYSVGDNVPNGAPLLHVHGTGSAIPEWQLRRTVKLSTQRTIEQDPKYAIRLLVDIACKALSAAISDPTTAVQALDQLDDLMRRIGVRQIDVGYAYDKNEVLRVLYPTPTWEDLVALAFDEIRAQGINSLQVTRRLQALLNDLHGVLPPSRQVAIAHQLRRLTASVDRAYVDLEDRAEAHVADRQGIGLSARLGLRQQSQPGL